MGILSTGVMDFNFAYEDELIEQLLNKNSY
jgi:hypothetical protein